MYVCMHVGIVCIYTCVHASMCICMHAYMCICVHTCMYVIFKLGFERYGRGNCPSWEGELSRGELSGGELSVPHTFLVLHQFRYMIFNSPDLFFDFFSIYFTHVINWVFSTIR